MPRRAVQLYTVRDVELPVSELFERVTEAGFEGVELAYRFADADPETVRAALDEAGLTVVGAHVPFDRLVDDVEATVERYRTLGCESLIVPQLDESYFESAEGVERAAERLSATAAELEAFGVGLLYHNHAFEFRDIDGVSAFSRLVDSTAETVGFELDVGLATKAGRDPTVILRRDGDRISRVHVTDTDVDVAERGHVELGEGDVELESCVTAADDAAVEWYVFEHGQSTDQLATLQRGGRRLSKLLNGR